MKKVKVLLSFKALSVPKKIVFGRNVIEEMTGNANFVTPNPTIAVLTQTTDDLETAESAALGGGEEQTAIMHQKEKIWDDTFELEAKYVDGIANGDEAIILSSGFNHSKQPQPHGIPDAPENVKIKSGDRSEE